MFRSLSLNIKANGTWIFFLFNLFYDKGTPCDYGSRLNCAAEFQFLLLYLAILLALLHLFFYHIPM